MRLSEYLNKRGLVWLELILGPNQPWPGFPHSKVECIFIGDSPRGIKHAIVGLCQGKQMQIVFDPHPSNAGLDGVDSVAFIIPQIVPKERRIITMNGR